MINKYFKNRNLVYIYVAFFGFFFVFENVSILAPIYLEKKTNSVYYVSLFFSLANAVGVIFPLIGRLITSKVSRSSLVNIVFLIMSSMLIMTAYIEKTLPLFIIFLLIFGLKNIFNQALNPYIGNLNNFDTDKVFAIRDLFLFLGAGLGLSLSSILKNNNLTWAKTSFILALLSIIIFIILRIINVSIQPVMELNRTEKRVSTMKNKFTRFENKRNLAVLIIMYISGYFVSSLFQFLPIICIKNNVKEASILLIYSISYYAVPILSLLSVKYFEKTDRKYIFIFDHLFDILPILLLVLIPGNSIILLLILVIFNIKDIVSPISIAYFFNCFSESDGNTAWALVGAIANTFSILSPIIIGMLFEKSIFLMEILIIISLLVTGIVGIILLPKQQKEGKN